MVSDNASTDETAAVVSGAARARVRYVRTERPLSMPDSWEFALAQARGEYITYLCDDDAIAPGTLRTIERVLERTKAKVVMWGGATYYDESWPEADRRNTAVVPTFTGKVIEVDSASKLREVYGLRYGRTPMLVNSVCHVSLVEEVKRKAGRFFIGYSPDFAAGVAMFAHVSSFVFVDTILSVGGATEVSTGMMVRQSRGEIFQQTIRDLGEWANLRRVPLRIQVLSTQLAEHFLLLEETFPGGASAVRYRLGPVLRELQPGAGYLCAERLGRVVGPHGVAGGPRSPARVRASRGRSAPDANRR